MTTQNKWIITVCAIIAVFATGATAYYYLKPRVPDPAKMSSEQMFKYVQSQDFNNLKPEQRFAFFRNMADARTQEYFKTPPQDRDKYLDKVIDDMQKYIPLFMQQQRGRDPNGMRQMAQRFRNANPEQRRAFRETMDPVKMSMQREFGAALFKRAMERGITMGGFGRGFGGQGGNAPRK